MKKLKCAVIGTGYFGSFHAEKYANLPQCDLVGVSDKSAKICEKVAYKNNTKCYTNYQDLIGKIDAASIATATLAHYEVAKELLSHGIHILVEKPIASKLQEAEELVQIAKENHCILQVGHVERFNPVITLLEDEIHDPEFIEVTRLSPYNPRSNDTDVILDLMIHDLDLILNFVKSKVVEIQAKGIGIWSSVDIANARLVFENGCIANITESRFSVKKERKFRIFTGQKYYSIDMQERNARSYLLKDVQTLNLKPKFYNTDIDADPLKAEIEHFVSSIQRNQQPKVDGVQGKNALALALQVKEVLEKQKK